MSVHAYTEDQLVEQPAIGLFGELGWQTVSALEEIHSLSRRRELLLVRRHSAQVALNSPAAAVISKS
jgi:type I restriction enzyme R subunit